MKTISDDSDVETGMKSKAHTNDNQTQALSKTSVELKENLQISSIKDIPNYQVLLIQNVPSQVPQPTIIGPNVGSNSGAANEAPTTEQIN